MNLCGQVAAGGSGSFGADLAGAELGEGLVAFGLKRVELVGARGDASADPSLPIWAQLQNQIGDLDDLQTYNKGNLVDAINEARSSGGSAPGCTLPRLTQTVGRTTPLSSAP